MNVLHARICDSPKEAPNYNGGDFAGANLKEAVIVLKGTEAGKPTVDLVFEIVDAKGAPVAVAVAMTTGEIIKMLAGAIIGAETRKPS